MPSVHVSLFIIDVPVYVVQAVFEGFTSDSMTTTRYQSTVNSRSNMTTTTTTTTVAHLFSIVQPSVRRPVPIYQRHREPNTGGTDPAEEIIQ